MRSWLLAGSLLAALAVFAVGFWLLRPGSDPLIVDYYRVSDENTLVIGTTAGDGEETRITAVVETSDSVTITAQTFRFMFGPMSSIGRPVELVVELDRPLGDRGVFDPYHAVPRDRSGEP